MSHDSPLLAPAVSGDLAGEALDSIAWLAEAAASKPAAPGANVHFSSQTVEWPTPQWLFEALHAEFGFTLDPCSTHENAKCPKHYTRSDSGLLKTWQAEVVWMNPPYGTEIAAWMRKAHDAAMNDGATCVCLVPARTDTAWWHEVAMKHEIRLLRGRLTFDGAENPAPFPSAIVVMRPRSFRLLSAAASANVRMSDGL
ncbi:MAG: adenine methyltransferase [Chthoniobacterales bacterium]|nr:adenine methyltransferase [Chthoniobacterales bacterium]